MVVAARADQAALDAAEGARVTRYAHAVVSGNQVAGELVRRACERHLRDLETGHERGLRFDAQKAGWAIRFFPMVLRHYKGEWGPMPGVRQEGLPVELEDWQAFIIGCIFGWLRRNAAVPETSLRAWLRRFGRAYIEVAKKNGKTLMAAGLEILLTFFDGEPGAEGYTAATKKEQARLPWKDAKVLVERSPVLRRRLRTSSSAIWDPETDSSLKALSKETGGEEGINPHSALVDELHRLTERDMVDMLTNSMTARAQPLIAFITTAGAEGESIWAEEHDYAEKVVNGAVEDDDTFAYIAMLDEDDDPFDESKWVKANPNLGVSVRLEEMRARAREAKESPAKLNAFLRFRLNRRTGNLSGWVAMETWNANSAKPAYTTGGVGGLDLSSTTDLTAFSVMTQNGEWTDWLVWFWLPAEGIEARERRDRVPYQAWARQGLIRLTEGNVVDYDRVLADVVAIVDRLGVREIGYDPWNATDLVTRLMAKGMKMLPVRQGVATLSAPMKEAERRLGSRKVRHGGNPVLRWMAASVAVKMDEAGNVKPDRKSSRSRIDGIVSGLMALTRLMVPAPPPPKRRVMRAL